MKTAEVVDETPEFQATVRMEVQAKVDANHPDGMVDTSEGGSTVRLEQEERIRARGLNWSASVPRRDGDARGQGKAYARHRSEAEALSGVQSQKGGERGPVDGPRAGRPSCRNSGRAVGGGEQAVDAAGGETGWLVASSGGRRLGEAVVSGKRPDGSAVVRGCSRKLQTAPGQVVPIGMLEDVNRKEVSIEGTVTQLWEPSSSAISQSRTYRRRKWTDKVHQLGCGDQPWIEEESTFVFVERRRTGTTGRVSVALTGWTTVNFPERGRWWE